ncbi:uncharacterized protein [Procambarus clarkii]|uniref:uncharacterized protein n=1 Tax=Procambarus clarkii TaxID=6728 RepID=UPI0037425D9A
MKLLVLVILAAAACASEIEKRDAEPSYVTSNYGSAYPAYSHRYHNGKRSAEPEPEPSYPIYSSGLRHGYDRHYYKRSAEPEPEPSYPLYYAPRHGYRRHFYKRGFVILVAATCASEIEKRDAEPSYVTSNYGSAYHAYFHSFHNGKRSAEPEPSYPVYSYGQRHGYGRHFYMRSAEPEPEPLYPVYYAPRHRYGRHFYKRSADPEPSYSFVSNYGYRPLLDFC